MALEVRIRKKLGAFQLDIDFTAENEVFALLGASGCGKSMTLKCIAGIEQPDEGRIVLGGRVLYDSSRKINLPPQKRRVGYMFQDYALFPNMTVRQNVMTGMGKKPDAAKVDAYLARFHIAELADHLPSQLSGGQKQRVAMARIVAQEPDAILLDEPFSALDSHLKWQLEREMKSILSEVEKPSVFVSHNRDEVYHLCRTVCCMNAGKTEVIRPLKAFFDDPGTRSAALLSGCKNISAVRILDAHHLEAVDWKTTLTLRREIQGSVDYIGLRAHYIAAQPTEGCDNELVPAEMTATEDPFEWTVFLKMAADAEPLQWKTAKEEGRELVLPEKYYVNSDSFMLLRA